MGENAIEVKGVSKSFKLPNEHNDSLKGAVVNFWRHERGYKMQHVLHDVSFNIKKGEFFGIVGRNGSGKSTLLKIISGIYTPDEGAVNIHGSLTPFIELGVGFNSQLSGRDNVYLNGAMLGFSESEMDDMYDEIVDFAELGEFMDQKLKNYSSGMQVRLAFSIAIRANSDILVLDEVLAVGDEAFKRKCYKYFAELKREKKTIILVTHSMDQVAQFCDRALIIESGEIKKSGNPAEVAEEYKRLFSNDSAKKIGKSEAVNNVTSNDFDATAELASSEKELKFEISVQSQKDIEDAVLGIFIRKDSGETIWRWASDDKTKTNEFLGVDFRAGRAVKLSVRLDNVLPEGSFTFSMLIRNRDRSEEFVRFADIVRFDNYSNSVYGKYWKLNETIKAVE